MDGLSAAGPHVFGYCRFGDCFRSLLAVANMDVTNTMLIALVTQWWRLFWGCWSCTNNSTGAGRRHCMHHVGLGRIVMAQAAQDCRDSRRRGRRSIRL